MSEKVNYLTDDPFCTYKSPDDGLPWFINLSITNRCNLACLMCQSNSAIPHVIKAERLVEFIKRLSKWLKPPRRATVTGGEPLTHPYVVPIIGTLANAGYLPALNTNAAALGVETADELIDAGLAILNISLDGVGEVHDNMRNGPGLYRGVMDMLHHLGKHTDLQLNIVSVISAANADSLPEMVRILDAMPRVNMVNFQAVAHTLSKGWSEDFYKQSPLWPKNGDELSALMKILDELEKLKDNGARIKNPPSQFAHWRRYFSDPIRFLEERSCHVADSMFQVFPGGEITFCSYFEILGTIDDDPKKLWESEKADEIRKRMTACKKPCNYYINCCYLEE